MKQQFLLPLEHTVTRERACALVDIPDRTTAEYELEKLQRQFKADLLTAKIRKNRPGPRSTYTINYKVRETATVRLF